MKFKRIISLCLLMVMLLGSLSLPSLEGMAATKADPGHRRVHLYAQKTTDTNPVTKTTYSTTVSINDSLNVYLAVNDPNKGDYDEATGTHKEPQYDMNGYTVKIYFDPYYFEYYPDPNTTSPLDYTVPGTQIGDSGNKEENVGGEIIDTPQEEGYYPYVPPKIGQGELNGKKYTTVHATIFFGGTYLPQTDGRLWYNLCALPLRAKNTGSTEVYVENGTADKYSLELFAKDVSDEYSPTFQFDIENGGYHTIIIDDDYKPAPPVPDPPAGTYTEAQTVTLTAEDDCDIYYAIDSTVPTEKYEGPIRVPRSCVISCYAQRKTGDMKKSNTVSYTYRIVPEAPTLFKENDGGDKKEIETIHEEYSAYRVYVSDSKNFRDIDDENEVYYTFGDGDAADPVYGDNPYDSWVKITAPASAQYIDITKNEVVRLFTKNKLTNETSDISWYYLNIKPDKVVADPGSGTYSTKIEVELTTRTEGATIYYALGNADPRTNGIEYKSPLPFYNDTTLRAVAFYDGVYSDVTSFSYLFNVKDDYGVDAFYPSGTYTGSVDVTLMPFNPEYSVEYTINGEGPYTYDKVINIDKDSTIVARAVDDQGNKGSEYTFTYEINPQPPIFAPESTQFSNYDKITVYTPESNRDTTSRYQLLYTIGGGDPTVSGTPADDSSDAVTIDIRGYTVVSAVVLKDGKKYSSVVTHSYDIVSTKPVKPLTTLLPGQYTVTTENPEGYKTQFVPVPEGTEIYYTISSDGSPCPDPVVGSDGNTYKYEEGSFIEICGKTVIKAVAVNEFGIKSDTGIFGYTITPESPKAAPSALINSDTLPLIEVEAVPGSTLDYTMGDFKNSFTVPDNGKLYINTQTKNAYADAEQQNQLGSASPSQNTDSAELSMTATLNGVTSMPTDRHYMITDDESVLAPPYADKQTGQYDEIDVDGNNSLLLVRLNSLNSGDIIEYKFDNEESWTQYTRGDYVKIKHDTVLQIRSVKNGVYSSAVSYGYKFIPLPPIITLPSGRYAQNPVPQTEIVLDPDAPDFNYSIFYRANGDPTDYLYLGDKPYIEYTMSFRAYVYNEDTGKTSPLAINYYIIEPDSSFSGSVRIREPYTDTRISAHKLSDSPYVEGIRLYTLTPNVNIKYSYEYTDIYGVGHSTDNIIYNDDMPIFANASMKNITIRASLVDDTGRKIEGSDSVFPIEFVHLGIPTTSLGDSHEVDKGADCTILNTWENDKTVSIYYTLDGKDPTQYGTLYDGTSFDIDKTTTVRAVYRSACGKCVSCIPGNYDNCVNPEFGKDGTYTYTIPKTVTVKGGGGGAATATNSRKYTKDIFGNEHPTHIGYINGYPDGSVQPDGNISREEIAAILYRITNHEYEKPFIETGEVFPDVEKGRWSAHDIEYMADKEVIVGYPDGLFVPAGKLTRAEFAALIYRFANIRTSNAKNPFSDLEESHWAYNEIISLAKTGLVEGYEDGTFRPQNNITRAEVMTVINKLLGRKPLESYVKSLEFNPYTDLYEDKWYYVTVLEATITHNYYLNNTGYEYKWEDWK